MILENHTLFVRSLHLITKDFFGALTRILNHLDIDRYFYCLLTITRQEDGITQKELVQTLDVDKVTMSRMIDYLVQKGYVVRQACEHDRRTTMLRPTAKACREISEIQTAFQTLESKAFEGLPKEVKTQFLLTVQTIQTNMSQLPRELVKFNYSKLNSTK